MLLNYVVGEDSWESLGLQGDQINQSILKEISPKYSSEGLMLKLKLQYSGHLIWRANSLEKTLMLGKIEAWKRRGLQRTKWLDGIINSRNLLKLTSIESVMSSNHLTFCHFLLFLPSVFHSIRVFSNESVVCIRWPKYWSFSISPSNEYSGLLSFRIDWLVWSSCSPRDSQESSPTT